jgi:predicted CopG family antitoxin
MRGMPSRAYYEQRVNCCRQAACLAVRLSRACIVRSLGSNLDAVLHTCNITCMSIKTIAVDSKVYEKLAIRKGSAESFSKAIDRLLSEASPSRYTGADVLTALAGQTDIPEVEARAMLHVISQNRAEEKWQRNDLS